MQHTCHIQERTKHPKLLSTTTTNEPIKETKKGKWGQKERKRVYQKDVHQRTTKLTYAKTIGDEEAADKNEQRCGRGTTTSVVAVRRVQNWKGERKGSGAEMSKKVPP